jgi:hypothetical protein
VLQALGMTPVRAISVELTPSLRFLLDRIAYNTPPKQRTVWLGLRAFRETLAQHDGRRLVRALRQTAMRPHLADELETALETA